MHWREGTATEKASFQNPLKFKICRTLSLAELTFKFLVELQRVTQLFSSLQALAQVAQLFTWLQTLAQNCKFKVKQVLWGQHMKGLKISNLKK